MAAMPSLAQAQAPYPQKPIRIIVPYTAGGASDVLARLIANKLQVSLGQPVIVENKVGASGAIGTDYVAKSPSDGYTLVVSDLGTLTIGPSIYPNLPFDVERDLAPVTILTSSPYLVTVNPGLPIRNLKELIDYSRAHPTKLNYASSGIGTNPHMAGLLFATRMGLQWTYIPSKGGSQAITDVIGGQADLMFNSAFSTSAFVKGGKLRLLAVSTAKRMAAYADVPSLSEVLPGYNTGAFQALFAPAGTPPDIVARLNSEVVRILALPDVKQQLDGLGAEAYGSTVESMRQFVSDDRQRWARLVKEQNFKVER
ncbi:tripartite tricarboxylate transporter substrate binding protein [Pseudomonas sp.]|uniref:Bug family tripartite tricarboxylate transporter substrate binding protein n=1 Tax=Pseudomonas sp. TaxID=306 RepID=UPI0025CCB909|nr:tripartite tricarboxylate transporter substrate binding protein [Pseudomonas sp.]